MTPERTRGLRRSRPCEASRPAGAGRRPLTAFRGCARATVGAVAAVAAPRWPVAGPCADRAARALDVALVAALTAGSVVLRAPGLHHRLWMDEGIAVGIASHPLVRIPEVLRLDGSPPLYYVLLHAWMGVAGRSEVAVHLLSLMLVGLCVPAAWWAARAAVDRRTARLLAALVAASPFLTTYAREARMYTLVVLLGLVCVGCFASAYVRGRRGQRLPFAIALALLLYTHNWALFLGAGLALAFAVVTRAAPARERPVLLRDGLVGFGLAAALYLPWVPSVVAQARHTGAPWATVPGVGAVATVPAALFGGTGAMLLVALAVGIGLARARGQRALAIALAAAALVPPVLGWLLSQVSPAWSERYLAVVVAPALLLAAVGIAHAGRAGVAALAGVVALWATAGTASPMSDAFAIAHEARPMLRAGDLVVSTEPEQVPLLAYYLRRSVRFASAFGPARDTGVADWRDAVRHLERTSVSRQLVPLLDRVPAGRSVMLVVPVGRDRAAWRTPWARRLHARATADEAALDADRRFVPVASLPRGGGTQPLRAVVFRRRRTGAPTR
jgi:mannosyltransferase